MKRFTLALMLMLCMFLFGCNIVNKPEASLPSSGSPSTPSSVIHAASSVASESLPSSSATSSAVVSESSEAILPSKSSEEQPQSAASHEASNPPVIVGTDEKRAPNPENWYLHLTNFDHPLPDDYQPELAEVQGGYYYDARAAEPLMDMLAAAEEDGVTIYVTSAFRAMAFQVVLYENEIQSFRDLGYDEEEAVALGGSLVAYPGTSEHQLGLAVDLVTPDHWNLTESFDETEGFAWLDAHAAEHGFILRFPKDKTAITRISYEPWHYRYVTPEHAMEIKRLGLCLEEYLELLND